MKNTERNEARIKRVEKAGLTHQCTIIRQDKNVHIFYDLYTNEFVYLSEDRTVEQCIEKIARLRRLCVEVSK